MPKEMMELNDVPSPTMFISGDFVKKVFPGGLPKLGAVIALKVKVSSISEREGESDDKKKSIKSVEVQLVDNGKPADDEEIDLDEIEDEKEESED